MAATAKTLDNSDDWEPGVPFLNSNLIVPFSTSQPGIVAAVDAGSNSLRLIILKFENGIWSEIFNTKKPCALGKGMKGRYKRLNPDGKDLARKFFIMCGIELAKHNVNHAYFVTTAALRDTSEQGFIKECEQLVGWGIKAARALGLEQCTVEDAEKFIEKVKSRKPQKVFPHEISFTRAESEQEGYLTCQAVLTSIPNAHGTAFGIGGRDAHGGRFEHGKLISDSLFDVPMGMLNMVDKYGNSVDDAQEEASRKLRKHCSELAGIGGIAYVVSGTFRGIGRGLVHRVYRASITAKFIPNVSYNLHDSNMDKAWADVARPEYIADLKATASRGLRGKRLTVFNESWHRKIGERAPTFPVGIGILKAFLAHIKANSLIFEERGLIHGIYKEAGLLANAHLNLG